MNAFVEKTIRPDIRPMQSYPVHDATGMVKLDVMENPYRLPDALAAEVAEVVKQVAMNRYPIPTAPALRALMREVLGIAPHHELLLGNGSDECITYVTQAIAKPGAKVLSPVPTFPMYKMNAQFNHLEFIGVPLNIDLSLNLDAMLAAIAEHQPALTWLAYPNNPTGNAFPEAAVEAIIRAAPGLVIVDEAYQPFAKKTFLNRIDDFENLVVMRTFSKIGFAGLRLGYVVGSPAWLNEFDKLRAPFNINVITQAVAHKLLQHKHVFDAQCEAINVERERVFPLLAAMPGVVPHPSAANFILARVKSAPQVLEGMKTERVLVKSFHGAHPLLENCLRITIGTPEENNAMLAALRKYCV
jgi:histidinol-phosphate aminotransferase